MCRHLAGTASSRLRQVAALRRMDLDLPRSASSCNAEFTLAAISCPLRPAASWRAEDQCRQAAVVRPSLSAELSSARIQFLSLPTMLAANQAPSTPVVVLNARTSSGGLSQAAGSTAALMPSSLRLPS